MLGQALNTFQKMIIHCFPPIPDPQLGSLIRQSSK